MKKRRLKITASKSTPIPVLACFDKSSGPGKKTYLSLLACNSCDTQVLANNFVAPFCPCCASDEIIPVSDDLMEHSKRDIEEMKPIAHCDECDTVISSPLESLASLSDDAIYCPSCSAVAKAISASDEDEEDEEDNEEDSEGLDETVDEDTDDLFNNDENEGGESEEGETSEDNGSSEEEETTGESENTETDMTDKPTDTENTDSTSTNESGESQSINADLVKLVSGSSGATAIVPSPDRSAWWLFVDGKPVATSSKENASDNVQSMFSTDKFATAWEAATSEGVTEDVLNDFGFTSIKMEVPVEDAVKQNLEAAIQENKKSYEMAASEASARFQRCFGIAAVGINKNVFKEENPVKSALTASLSSRKVRGAEQLIAAAFKQHGEQYLKNIALKASELMEKSDETLDDLAETVDEAKYDDTVVDETAPAKPSVVKLFPVKEEETNTVDKTAEPIKLAASDETASAYANILSGASLRA